VILPTFYVFVTSDASLDLAKVKNKLKIVPGGAPRVHFPYCNPEFRSYRRRIGG
jgi:hypothetical protein